jgi:hypothetical protein
MGQVADELRTPMERRVVDVNKIRDRLHLPRKILGISAEFVTVATAIALVGPTLVGLIAGSLAAALLTALIVILLLVVYLTARIQRLERTLKWHRLKASISEAKLAGLSLVGQADHEHAQQLHARFDEFRSVVERIAAGDPVTDAPAEDAGSPAPSEPSDWLPDPGDPMTFAMRAEHFEALLTEATRRAREELGDDARVVLSRIFVHFSWFSSRVPRVLFTATSETSQKQSQIEFIGSLDRVQVSTLPVVDYKAPKMPVRHPWQVDPRYCDLIHTSWRRMNRPFEGLIILMRRSPELGLSTSPWLAVYVHVHGPQAGEGQLFTLAANGGLQEIKH